MAQQVMNLPANEGDIRDVRSIPGSGSPLEEKWQPTPAFLPREFHGQRSLAGYSPWGRKESDMAEQLTLSLSLIHFQRGLGVPGPDHRHSEDETRVQSLGS